VCVALLIASQLILSGIAGIEIVTVLMLCFCFGLGALRGVAIATAFSLLRCLIFGFYIQVVLLYLIYYNAFALFFGWLGGRFKRKATPLSHGLSVAFAVLFTVGFTLLDNLITPLVYGMQGRALRAYFYASLYAVVPQTICAAVTVALLFRPLVRVLRRIAE
jgi:hypothetical protein